jgi:alpha-beta hydrolase superfamily lysophospholipase
MKNKIKSTRKYILYESPFSRDEMYLYGQIYVPNGGKEKYPAVILSHGYGGAHSSLAFFAEYLAEAGIVSYVFDFRGGGYESKSGGSPLEMSLLTEVDDLNAVIEFIQTIDYVDKNNLFLIGESQGGVVSALSAAQKPSEIRGLVLLYPAFPISENARSQYSNPDDIPDRAPVFSMTVGKKYYEDALKIDVYNDIRGFTKPVLLIHGDRDPLVPLIFSQRAAGVYQSARLIVVPGGGHKFYGTTAKPVAEDITAFINAAVSDMQAVPKLQFLEQEPMDV